MALRKFAITSVLALMVFVAAPAKASADWLFTPFIGMNWGGTAEFTDFGGDFEDEFEQKMNFGASLVVDGRGRRSASRWTSATRRTSSRTPPATTTSSSATATSPR